MLLASSWNESVGVRNIGNQSKKCSSSVTMYTHSMVRLLTLSNVSRCARSNSSWYLSIRNAFSQSLTVDTDDKSVGVGLSSGWEQLLYQGRNVKNESMYKNSTFAASVMFYTSVCQKLPSHRVGSALREAGCLISRSKDDRSESKPSRSPRSACQHWSIREWRAGGQLWGAGSRYWSATAFITCREKETEKHLGQMAWAVLCNFLT